MSETMYVATNLEHVLITEYDIPLPSSVYLSFADDPGAPRLFYRITGEVLGWINRMLARLDCQDNCRAELEVAMQRIEPIWRWADENGIRADQNGMIPKVEVDREEVMTLIGTW
jgi:hypothetical protein